LGPDSAIAVAIHRADFTSGAKAIRIRAGNPDVICSCEPTGFAILFNDSRFIQLKSIIASLVRGGQRLLDHP
jgi:hypothetical protein